MQMHVTRNAVLCVLEVMVFEIRQRVAHVLLAAEEWAAVVQQLLAASYRAAKRNFLEVALGVELRTNGTGTQF